LHFKGVFLFDFLFFWCQKAYPNIIKIGAKKKKKAIRKEKGKTKKETDVLKNAKHLKSIFAENL